MGTYKQICGKPGDYRKPKFSNLCGNLENIWHFVMLLTGRQEDNQPPTSGSSHLTCNNSGRVWQWTKNQKSERQEWSVVHKLRTWTFFWDAVLSCCSNSLCSWWGSLITSACLSTINDTIFSVSRVFVVDRDSFRRMHFENDSKTWYSPNTLSVKMSTKTTKIITIHHAVSRSKYHGDTYLTHTLLLAEYSHLFTMFIQ